MSVLTTIAKAFLNGVGPSTQLASPFADLDTQMQEIRNRGQSIRNYRMPSVEQALGVPAIWAAVQLIAGTVGSLSMEAYQNNALIIDPNKVPRLLQRPNPKTTPREFFRDTAFYLATRGEAWWYVAVRDGDGLPQALVCVPPWEVQVRKNPNDRFNPDIFWLGKPRSVDDMRQLTYMPGPVTSNLRGVGPLQIALAAISVSIEADAWAANFFSGSIPSIVGTTDMDLGEEDLKLLDKQWTEKDGNLPRWMTNGMHLAPSPFDNQKAQMIESRQHEVGNAARMFGLPGPLLEYQMSGQSLTYRNQADIWTLFLNQCLNPHYLEPMQQEMSDLLVRSVLGKFNTDQLQKADIATRYQAYQVGIQSGFLQTLEVRQKEGLAPGNVDFAAVPPSPPQAQFEPIRSMSSAGITVLKPRCKGCDRQWAVRATTPFEHICPRCKTLNVA